MNNLRLGENTPKRFFLGNAEVVRMYMGDTLVYQATQYIDLGLPSGTLWANRNLGAENPEDTGLYFAWGETTGYQFSERNFTRDTYQYYSNYSMTKYNTTDTIVNLELSDDAANVFDERTHMPTKQQCQELIDNTTYTTFTLNGVQGIKFVSKTDSSKYIFIPFAGYSYNNTKRFDTNAFYIQTNERKNTSNATNCVLRYVTSELSVDDFSRYYGTFIRSVKDS